MGNRALGENTTKIRARIHARTELHDELALRVWVVDLLEHGLRQLIEPVLQWSDRLSRQLRVDRCHTYTGILGRVAYETGYPIVDMPQEAVVSRSLPHLEAASHRKELGFLRQELRDVTTQRDSTVVRIRLAHPMSALE